MNALHAGLVLLDWAGTGLLLPVLSLALLAKGCSLATLGAAMACYSLATVAAELPSGRFADRFGRKPCFLLANGLTCLAFVLLLAAQGLPPVCAAMALYGAGRAFGTGSLDALVVEQRGTTPLPRTVSRLAAFQSAGLAVGATVGGLLPAGGYGLHLALRAALAGLAGVWGAFALREGPHWQATGSGAAPEGGPPPAAKGALAQPATLARLLACIAANGVAVALVETYWQPRLAAVLTGSPRILLGILCTAAYGATILGNLLAARRAPAAGCGLWRAYGGLLAGAGAALALLAAMGSPAGFAAAYLAIYLFLGAIEVPEKTILHSAVPNSCRAFALSLGSLYSQGGGFLGSLMAAALVGRWGVPGLWRVGATALALAGLWAVAAGPAGPFQRLFCPRVKHSPAATCVADERRECHDRSDTGARPLLLCIRALHRHALSHCPAQHCQSGGRGGYGAGGI